MLNLLTTLEKKISSPFKNKNQEQEIKEYIQ